MNIDQLTKRCLEGRPLESFKVSSWFLKIKTSNTEYATIFIIVVGGCIIIIHEAVTCDST